MTRPRREVSRTAEITLAISMATVGLSTAALRLLAQPTSWLSRLVDSRETVGGAS